MLKSIVLAILGGTAASSAQAAVTGSSWSLDAAANADGPIDHIVFGSSSFPVDVQHAATAASSGGAKHDFSLLLSIQEPASLVFEVSSRVEYSAPPPPVLGVLLETRFSYSFEIDKPYRYDIKYDCSPFGTLDSNWCHFDLIDYNSMEEFARQDGWYIWDKSGFIEAGSYLIRFGSVFEDSSNFFGPKSASARLELRLTEVAGSVPEASTWAMMLGGFAALGTVLRAGLSRRRHAPDVHSGSRRGCRLASRGV